MYREILFFLSGAAFGFIVGHCIGFVSGVKFSQKGCVGKREHPVPTTNEITARFLDES